jgi:6-phosphogluconolactonase
MITKRFIFSDEFIQAVQWEIIAFANERIAKANVFRIVLTGGNTAKTIYSNLIECETDWSKWEFYFGDERFVETGSPELNFSLAEEFLFSKVPVAYNSIVKFDTALSLKDSAINYEKRVSKVDTFDLVLFGIGADGHIASLFPNLQNDLKFVGDSVAIVTNSPKPPVNRFTLTLDRLNRSLRHLIFTEMKGKENIVSEILNGSFSYPISALSPLDSLKFFYLE